MQESQLVKVIEGVLSDADCDAILAEYTPSDEWESATIGDDNSVDGKVRSNDLIAVSLPEVIGVNQAARQQIDEALFGAVSKALGAYAEAFPFVSCTQDCGYQLLRYQPGQFYRQHVDAYKAGNRVLSCSVLLNDDFDGGEWAFWSREAVFCVPKGAAIVFPSNSNYPHEILPVTSGTRYSAITWFF